MSVNTQLIPTCDNVDLRRGCIESFSASQLSHVIVLFPLLWSLVSVEYTLTGFLSWIVNTAMTLNILYFIVGSWIIEEKYIYELRRLARPWCHLEFLIRLVSLIFLFVLLKYPILPSESSNFPVNLGLPLMVLSILYLVWDFVIYKATGSVPAVVHADFAVSCAAFIWILASIKLWQADLQGFLLAISFVLFLLPLGILYWLESDALRDFRCRLCWRTFRGRVR